MYLKLNTYSDGFKVLRTIARLYRTYKPMSFFGIIAFILAALGVGFPDTGIGSICKDRNGAELPDFICLLFYDIGSNSGILLRSYPADHWTEEPAGF